MLACAFLLITISVAILLLDDRAFTCSGFLALLARRAWIVVEIGERKHCCLEIRSSIVRFRLRQDKASKPRLKLLVNIFMVADLVDKAAKIISLLTC